MLKRFYSNKEKILEKSLKFFKNSNSLIPKIGCELEFFLLEGEVAASQSAVEGFIAELSKNYDVEKERGASQIEVKTDFTDDLIALCKNLESFKIQAENLALKRDLNISFAAQPFTDDCGNALQFNISLHDLDGKNLFLSDEKLLKNSAESLLSATDLMMIFLAPKAEDYQRFSRELNIELFKKGKFTAPVNLSFGCENRSCAIRIPKIKIGKRLEFRIAAASADPFLSIAAILISLTKPTEEKFEQIFGNAFDEKYSLKNFPKNIAESEEKFFTENNFIRKAFLSHLCKGDLEITSIYPQH